MPLEYRSTLPLNLNFEVAFFYTAIYFWAIGIIIFAHNDVFHLTLFTLVFSAC